MFLRIDMVMTFTGVEGKCGGSLCGRGVKGRARGGAGQWKELWGAKRESYGQRSGLPLGYGRRQEGRCTGWPR